MPILITLLAFILWWAEPISSDYLAYIATDIEHGQWWRILTGNLLHTNTPHLLLNLGGLWLLFALHFQYYSYRWLVLVGFMCLAVGMGIWLFSPKIQWYVGLSGVLHGLFVLGAFYDIKHQLKSGWLLLLGVLIKVGYETQFGASQEVANLIGANVATDAHLYGALSGLTIIGLILIKHTRYRHIEE
jgi:rhomboid family GlyGly-CTERM serine protease